MKREYFPPQCEISDYEPETTILTGSTPQTTSASRAPIGSSKEESSPRGWGNVW